MVSDSAFGGSNNKETMTDDAQLLRDMRKSEPKPAFGELVSRHIDLVFSAAFASWGHDIWPRRDANRVRHLARKARSLPRDCSGGWLDRHACFTAAKACALATPQAREKTAME